MKMRNSRPMRCHRTVKTALVGILLMMNLGAAANPEQLRPQQLLQLKRGELIIHRQQRATTSYSQITALFPYTTEQILRLLTDYSRYPQFMPNVARIIIHQQTETSALLDYYLSLPLGKSKQYRLRMTLRGDGTQEPYRLDWQQQAWPGLTAAQTIKHTEGFWLLRALPDEGDKPWTQVVYQVQTDPGPVPFGLGWIVSYFSEQAVPAVVTATREQLQKLPR